MKTFKTLCVPVVVLTLLLTACGGEKKPFRELASVQEEMFSITKELNKEMSHMDSHELETYHKNTVLPKKASLEEKYGKALQALVGTELDAKAAKETGITFEEKLKVTSVNEFSFEKTICLWAKAKNAHICDTWDMVAVGYDGDTPACALQTELKFEPDGEQDIMQVTIKLNPHDFDFLKRVDKIVLSVNKETFWQLKKEQEAHEKEIIFKK